MLFRSKAFKAMDERKTPVASFYANISMFRNYYENKWFPYTMPISDIKGLRAALENYLRDKDVFKRHKTIAPATRKALNAGGLELYLDNGWADTVTVFNVPQGLKDTDILEEMCSRHGIMISGCFDVLAGKVLRIGHMGENCTRENVAETLRALQLTLENLGFKVKADMERIFYKHILY